MKPATKRLIKTTAIEAAITAFFYQLIEKLYEFFSWCWRRARGHSSEEPCCNASS
jgi:hypothetical protein